MRTKVELAECLEKAAELIEERGWGQHRSWEYVNNSQAVLAVGEYQNRKNFCLTGAVDTVCEGWWGEDWHRAFGEYGWDLIAWNDREGRTKEEVLTRLRQRAQLLKLRASEESADVTN